MVDFTAPVFYLGMDFYQGLPGFWLFPNYYLIAYRAHPVIKELPFANRIFALADKLKVPIPRDSGHLLAHPLVQDFILKQARGSNIFLSFFKPNRKVEIIAQRKSWHLIGNSHSLAKKLENKIQLWRSLRRYAQVPFLPGQVIRLGNGQYNSLVKRFGECFVLQLGYGWAGRSTFQVCSQQKFERLQQKFPKQWAKVSSFLSGWTLTNNNVVTKEGEILISPLARQITGQKEFCPGLTMATCGRIWPDKIDKKIAQRAREITQFIGRWLFRQRFAGFFGIDFLLAPDGQLFFQELNPRLTASAAFMAFEELRQKKLPLLLYHYASFLPWQPRQTWQSVVLEGGEVTVRVARTKHVQKVLPSGAYSFDHHYLGANFFPSSQRITFVGAYSGEEIRPGGELFRFSSLGRVGRWQGRHFQLALAQQHFYHWIRQFYEKT